MRGSVPGVVVLFGVGVGWGDGGHSGREAVWGVEVVMGAVCLGFRDSVVWGSPILHDPLRCQGRGTTARLLLAKLGLEGPIGAVAGVVPGCAALESAGGRPPRLAVAVGVGVLVGDSVLWWWGKCFLRAPLTLGVPSGSRGVSGSSGSRDDIGWTDALGACELVGHTELHTHGLPVRLYSSGKRVPRMSKRQGYVKDGLNTERKRNPRCVEKREARYVFTAHIGIHIHPIHGLFNQALRTARLSVTIWKNLRRNRRARFGGLGSVLSVPWKTASLG